MRGPVTLVLLLALLSSCSGTDDTATEGSTPPEAPEPAAEEPQAQTSRWSAGDTIPSGRQGVPDVQILAVHANGSGEECGEGRTATLKYKAMLANGTVLDPGSRPFSFRVGSGKAIEGWDVVVARMRVGTASRSCSPSSWRTGRRRAT